MASSSRRSSPPLLPPSAFYNQHRARPISRRTASSYEPFDPAHHRTASSSALPLTRTHVSNVPPPSLPVSPPPPVVSDPRFNHLFSTTLGSPFVTTADLELEYLDNNDQSRPSSPAPTTDFSIIDMDLEDTASIPGSYPTRLLSPNLGFSRIHPTYTSGKSIWTAAQDTTRPTPPNSLKGLLPRIWDALSSPGRNVLNFSPAANVNYASPSSSPSSSRTASPSALHVNQSWYTNNTATTDRNSSVNWYTSKGKGKAKAGAFFPGKIGTGNRSDSGENINYLELSPLDGEEGELIDDEGCFMDVRTVHGIDILSLLPPELALHVFVLLCSQPRSNASSSSHTPVSPGRSSLMIPEPDVDPQEALRTLLSCRLVSWGWCRLASDNAVWRSLFLSRWNVDLRRAPEMDLLTGSRVALQTRSVRATLGKTWEFDLLGIGAKAKRVLGLSSPMTDAPITSAPLRLDWRILYHERLELDHRWSGTAISRNADNGAKAAGASTRRMGAVYDLPSSMSASVRDDSTSEQGYEPTTTKITGHNDSVYCLEFDSRRIITGSRDRTIKVWSLSTGKQLGSFAGWHRGSVLCLKFERDWDREWSDAMVPEDEEEETGNTDASDSANAIPRPSPLARTGFMVSGSSDTTVCVWDLHLGAVLQPDDGASVDDDRTIRGNVVNDAEREVRGEVKAVLKGHNGGVLDIRIDKQWIVSCSKDAVIRVWDRKTLLLHRTLRGHEGPVNAVGLQSGKVVSASGDGKMILWDIESGERLRTFEGHDRGLACIEFKDDLIVSGSNDCKIKVWSASTGDCLRTLVGHDALVRALSFDPRSGRLVSASYDKSVRLWDLGTGKLVREFKKTHTSHIFDVKFDLARIVSTSHDQKIVVLDFSTNLNTALFV